ncbi:MAG TPA: hypothetical protein VGO60_09740 [Iamia sp.]|nr:hypothetical protein [Iamia sp.]
MRSDDELLSHIRQQVGVRRQRRRRAVGGVAAAAVVLLLGAGALAASSDEPDESVKADDGGSTTTEATTTTEEGSSTTDGTTSTTASTTTAPPSTDPTPTEPTTTIETPTTTEPGIAPVSQTSAGDGITLTVTATQDRARPGWVDFTIRIEDDFGSMASGSISWGQIDHPETPFGAWADYYPAECDELIDDDPTTDTAPDREAGPVDETFTFSHEYVDYGVDDRPGEVQVGVHAFTSFCTSESASTDVTMLVPVEF